MIGLPIDSRTDIYAEIALGAGDGREHAEATGDGPLAAMYVLRSWFTPPLGDQHGKKAVPRVLLPFSP